VGIERVMEQIDVIRSSITNLKETLADLSSSLLLLAIDGEPSAVGLEQRLQKARRALTKAEDLLDDSSNSYQRE